METTELAPVRQDQPVVLPVPRELSVTDVAKQADKIQELMRAGMKEGQHYGVIPGCDKPSLLQPGAEKLCLMFRLSPDYTVQKEERPDAEREWTKKKRDGGTYSGTCKGFIRYTVVCHLIHGPTGAPVAGGTGVANNWEPKFISRDPFEVEETILQFARKRALVNAVRTGTAASDIFTQDEDLIPRKRTPAQPATSGTTDAAPKPSAEGTERTCPDCGKPMRERNGKKGRFLGCTGYPDCRHTESVHEEKAAAPTPLPSATPIQESQIAQIRDLRKCMSLTEDGWKTWLAKYRVDSGAKLTSDQADDLIERMDLALKLHAAGQDLNYTNDDYASLLASIGASSLQELTIQQAHKLIEQLRKTDPF